MSGKKWFVLFFFFFLFPFSFSTNSIIDFSPIVNAISGLNQSVFGVQASVGGVNSSVADLNQQVVSLPATLTGFFTQLIKQSVGSFALGMVSSFQTFLTHQVDVLQFFDAWKNMVIILSAGYIAILSYFGLRLLQSGNNPIARDSAKSNMTKMVFLIFMTGISLELYQLLLTVSHALVTTVWTAVLDSFFTYSTLSSANFFMLFYFAGTVLFAFTTLFLRYLIVMVGILLFPLAIFLYFFEPTQAYGRLLVQLIGVSIFLPFFDVLVLWGTSLAMEDMGVMPGMELLFPGVGFLLLGLANAWLLLFASVHAATNHLQHGRNDHGV